MPWNITASIQGSHQGSSALIDFRRHGSASDFSSRGLPGSTTSNLKPWAGARGAGRSRLMSSSPLASRSGLPGRLYANSPIMGSENDNLDMNMDMDMDTLGDLDGSFQLENEEAAGVQSAKARKKSTTTGNQNGNINGLDIESLNFMEFIKTQLQICHEVRDRNNINEDENDNKGKKAIHYIPSKNEISFTSELLPPNKTNHKVATQGLMHVLTLATRGLVRVHQEEYYDDVRDGHGEGSESVLYCHGEIYLCLV